MHALTVSLDIASPFATGGNIESAVSIDRLLPRTLAADRPIIPGTLLRGLLRDALGTLVDRGHGRLPGPEDVDGYTLLGDLFGRRSGADRAGAGLNVDADGPDNEPQRGGLVVEDLVGPPTPRDFEKVLTRVAIDSVFGAAKEGALQVIESPWPVGEIVRFSGRILVAARFDAELVSRVLALALSAIDSIGAHKSAGFGQLVTSEVTPAGETAAPSVAVPAATPRAWRVVLSVDKPFLVAADRVAPNVFRGAATIPGGTIKGAFAEALRAQFAGDAELSALLSRTVFGHFQPIADTPAKALEAALPSPVPFSVACYACPGGNVLVRDTILDMTPVLRADGGRFVAPLFEIDWKGEHVANVRNHAAASRIAIPLGLDAEIREVRVRTAINYDKGTALYDEEQGGGLFVYSSVVPLARRPKSDPVPLCYVGEIAAATAEESERSAVRNLVGLLAGAAAWIGKTNAAIRVVALGPAPPSTLRPPPPGPDGSLLFPIVLRTPALLTPIDALRSANGNVGAIYADYFAEQAKETGLKLVKAHARQRLIGGYQVMRFRPPGSSYDPFVVTEPGSTFLLAVNRERQQEAKAWLAERLILGLREAEGGEPENTRWRRLPLARTNGFGAIAPDQWADPTPPDRGWRALPVEFS